MYESKEETDEIRNKKMKQQIGDENKREKMKQAKRREKKRK